MTQFIVTPSLESVNQGFELESASSTVVRMMGSGRRYAQCVQTVL